MGCKNNAHVPGAAVVEEDRGRRVSRIYCTVCGNIISQYDVGPAD